jgi:8-oxo-dGTP diphosphatase
MEKNPTTLFVVAVALRAENGRFLVQKRPLDRSMAGLWEFPGGKVERGEKPEAALIREITEELDVEIAEHDLEPLTFASHDLGGHHLLLLLYICRHWTGEPRGVESPELRWVTPAEMRELPMPPADAPFVSFLEQLL